MTRHNILLALAVALHAATGVVVQAWSTTTTRVCNQQPRTKILRSLEEDHADHRSRLFLKAALRPRFMTSSSTEETTSASASSPSSSSSSSSSKPGLPEIPNDYDWDEKYAGDSDWIMGDAVPGKQVLTPEQLQEQAKALNALEERWRKERLIREEEEAKKVGWVPNAELLNGRLAMFFLVTGLLTEYWTGVSLPGQVEELLRVLGVIGFE